MMEENKTHPVMGDMEESELCEVASVEDEVPALSEDEVPALPDSELPAVRRAVLWLRRYWAELLIVARYLLPLVSALALLVISLFYNVRMVSIGKRYEGSLARLLVNTLVGTHDYLGGELKAAKTTFYALLSGGSLVCMLCYLVALFFAGLAAYTACRAFRAGHESEESNRYKLIFKVAFPNRVCLFLSNALLLIPTLYPHFLSFIGSRFLLIGDEAVVYVLVNRPLIITGVMTALSLVLALAIPRLERRKKMNMFLICHDLPAAAPAEGSEAEEE